MGAMVGFILRRGSRIRSLCDGGEDCVSSPCLVFARCFGEIIGVMVGGSLHPLAEVSRYLPPRATGSAGETPHPSGYA